MKQSKLIFRLLPVLLAFCFFIGTCMPNSVLSVFANEYADNYESLSNEEKQAYLEQQLKELNKKLDDLAGQSKETEEYINALDVKIKNMNNQLSLAKEQMSTSQSRITTLKRQYSENEKKISSLQTEIKVLSKESDRLKEKFDNSFELYGQRARAMYVSGNVTTLEALLTSKDISTLLTRLEMIRRVSKHDKVLLEMLKKEGEELDLTKKELKSKKDSLNNNQKTLAQTQITLGQTIESLKQQQAEFAEKQRDYESEKSEADSLLIKIHEDTKNYSEFRHQSQEDIEEINREIEEAAQKYIEQLERETTTASTQKTTTSTTSSRDDEDETGDRPSSEKPTSSKPSTTTTKTTNKLSMVYPVPSQKKITTAYGSAGYVGHTGVDFACSSGSKVVAAESGIVIVSKDITSHKNCSCTYKGGGYHSYGRYIVIMHDKKNSAGDYVYTLYAHNSSRVVSEGQRVSRGQLIAYSGTTGNSSGPHCHFEVRTPTSAYNDCVNPTYYLH